MNYIKTVLSLVLFIIIPALLHAQSVALVLSGGGAKGFAHIGVLKALEENDIPVDFVVGNSMGALVGGLYASGYSPNEIEQLLLNPELFKFKRGNIKKEYYYFQKHEDDASWITIPFDTDEGLRPYIPFNMYNTQDLDYLLMELFASSSAAASYDFDSLLVPFRCVATDIDSSELMVLKSGDLAKAVRASITFPFFIRPIKINEKLLFDGGMLDNFPVSVAIESFHSDFIIGSQAVKNYESPDADDVFSQLQNMLMRKADFSLDSINGMIIESKTGNENVFQFQKIRQYVDSGYQAAIRSIPKLKEQVTERQSQNSIKEKRLLYNQKKPKLIIGDVLIEGVNEKQEQYFNRSINHPAEGVDSRVFKKQYDKLLANENVRSVYPSLCYNPESDKYDLTLNIKASEPFNLKFGGFISSSAVNEAFIGIGYKHLGKTSKHINLSTYFGTFYNSFSLVAKYEQQGKVPFDIVLDLLASRKNYFGNARYFFEDQSPVYIVIDENYLDVNIGLPVGLSHSLRAGLANINLNYLYHQDNYFTRTDTADRSNFYFLNPYIEFERNTLNKKQFASKGNRFYLGFNYYVGNEHTIPGSMAGGQQEFRKDHEFFVLSAHYQQYFNLFKPFVVGLTGDIVYSNKPLLSNYVSTLLIASQFEPITLMQTMFLENYRAYSYGSFGIKTIFNFYKHLELRLEGYYYVPYEKIINGPDNKPELSKPLSFHYLAGNAHLLYHTAIGPIGVSVNYFEKPGDKVSFLLSIGWSIYNKSRFYR